MVPSGTRIVEHLRYRRRHLLVRELQKLTHRPNSGGRSAGSRTQWLLSLPRPMKRRGRSLASPNLAELVERRGVLRSRGESNPRLGPPRTNFWSPLQMRRQPMVEPTSSSSSSFGTSADGKLAGQAKLWLVCSHTMSLTSRHSCECRRGLKRHKTSLMHFRPSSRQRWARPPPSRTVVVC